MRLKSGDCILKRMLACHHRQSLVVWSGDVEKEKDRWGHLRGSSMLGKEARKWADAPELQRELSAHLQPIYPARPGGFGNYSQQPLA